MKITVDDFSTGYDGVEVLHHISYSIDLPTKIMFSSAMLITYHRIFGSYIIISAFTEILLGMGIESF